MLLLLLTYLPLTLLPRHLHVPGDRHVVVGPHPDDVADALVGMLRRRWSVRVARIESRSSQSRALGHTARRRRARPLCGGRAREGWRACARRSILAVPDV